MAHAGADAGAFPQSRYELHTLSGRAELILSEKDLSQDPKGYPLLVEYGKLVSEGQLPAYGEHDLSPWLEDAPTNELIVKLAARNKLLPFSEAAQLQSDTAALRGLIVEAMKDAAGADPMYGTTLQREALEVLDGKGLSGTTPTQETGGGGAPDAATLGLTQRRVEQIEATVAAYRLLAQIASPGDPEPDRAATAALATLQAAVAIQALMAPGPWSFSATGQLLGAASTLLALTQGPQAWADQQRFEAIMDALAAIRQQLAAIQTQISEVSSQLTRLQAALDRLSGDIQKIKTALESVSNDVRQFRNEFQWWIYRGLAQQVKDEDASIKSELSLLCENRLRNAETISDVKSKLVDCLTFYMFVGTNNAKSEWRTAGDRTNKVPFELDERIGTLWHSGRQIPSWSKYASFLAEGFALQRSGGAGIYTCVRSSLVAVWT